MFRVVSPDTSTLMEKLPVALVGYVSVNVPWLITVVDDSVQVPLPVLVAPVIAMPVGTPEILTSFSDVK